MHMLTYDHTIEANVHVLIIAYIYIYTGSLDREIQSSHSFRVQATEEGNGRSSIVQMTITVLDENDNTPTFERSYFNLTVEEDEEVRNIWIGGHAPEGERGERERGRERGGWFAR